MPYPSAEQNATTFARDQYKNSTSALWTLDPSLLSPKGYPRFAVTGWMRIGGKDGSYAYVTSPDAAGHNLRMT